MTVTPEQIEGASFSTVKRGGYRTEEVDRFLDNVAGQVRDLEERVRTAEGANEDLQAASAEMATLMREVHAQLGERRRAAEIEVAQTLQQAEREAAGIVAQATEQAENLRLQADSVLRDAERHAELLRSDGEQRVRERAADTLKTARSELQDLLRSKHDVLHALTSVRRQLEELEATIESAPLSSEDLGDVLIDGVLIDLRGSESTEVASAARVSSSLMGAHVRESASHPSGEPSSETFFSPSDDLDD